MLSVYYTCRKNTSSLNIKSSCVAEVDCITLIDKPFIRSDLHVKEESELRAKLMSTRSFHGMDMVTLWLYIHRCFNISKEYVVLHVIGKNMS